MAGKDSTSSDLKRSLGLRHVFVLSTGGTISAGLFFLPSFAVDKAGPSAVLAYLVAGLLALPAMLSVSELSTAMPRAGGLYYFLARALGPAGGTLSGVSTWVSLVMKDAFALVGMSAYLNLIVDLPAKPTAICLIAFFTILNIVGSKTSASLQMGMVAFLLAVMGWYMIAGIPEASNGLGDFDPFFTSGSGGFIAAIGLVFISYGGLTKVASIAEEVEDPSKNIPLGVILSLIVSTIVYTVGVLVAVAAVPAETLITDQAPLHTAAEYFMPAIGAGFVIAAALAAFASAANAGILAAARYPMAMSRDGLMNSRFLELSRFGTPVWGIVLTGAGMGFVVVAFGAGAIAKLASAFVLVKLGLVNLAVIVLRSAKISSYAPGFKTPFYPFTQIVGICISIYLIVKLGTFPLLLVCAATLMTLLWYHFIGKKKATQKAGAIHHIYERLGRSADTSVDREISAAMQSHGLRSEDDYAGLVARASVLYVPKDGDINLAATRASQVLSNRIGIEAEKVNEQFLKSGSLWIQPSKTHPTATPVAFFDDAVDDHLVIVKSEAGIIIPVEWGGRNERVNALFFLAGTTAKPGRVLRLAGELAGYLDDDKSAVSLDAAHEAEVKDGLLPGLEIGQYPLLPETSMRSLIGKKVGDLTLDKDLHIEAIRRGETVLRADPSTELIADDQLTIIGPIGELPGSEELADSV
jgi:amino acid transporter|tara:strand:+ start:27634 stop:29718 length:2085 start_codon:yes stop_codon:yes gene_type:complete